MLNTIDLNDWQPNIIDLNDWLMSHSPEAYEALKYLNSADIWYDAALFIWKQAGSPGIE